MFLLPSTICKLWHTVVYTCILSGLISLHTFNECSSLLWVCTFISCCTITFLSEHISIYKILYDPLHFSIWFIILGVGRRRGDKWYGKNRPKTKRKDFTCPAIRAHLISFWHTDDNCCSLFHGFCHRLECWAAHSVYIYPDYITSSLRMERKKLCLDMTLQNILRKQRRNCFKAKTSWFLLQYNFSRHKT